MQELIESAKIRFPLSVSFSGKLTSTEIALIEKSCTVHCPSVYMDGSATYSIRFRIECLKQKAELKVN